VSLEDTELKIGNTSFKGVWIAIVLGIGSTIGGGVWTASSLYSRLEAVEVRSIPDVKPIKEDISLIKQQLADNDVSQLKAKLAELGTNITTIMEQQTRLLTLQQEVADLAKEIETIRSSVTEAKLIAESVAGVDDRMKKVEREIDDLWEGLDYVSNPLQ
jgi:DNA repair exonuclease SbcCD ATPase subunit